MQPALAQVSTLEASFERDIEDYASAHCTAVEVWLTKLENYLERHSSEELAQLLEQNQMSLPVASFQGGLLASQGEARREAWELFQRRLDLCRKHQIGTLVVAVDVPAPLSQTTLERVQMSLGELAAKAGQQQIRVALEFQAGSAFGNNLETAAALVADVGSPHLGLCLDTFHFHVGPSKLTDLGYLTAQNLFHVQLCDLADVPRELAADANRILPGDGDIALAPIVDRLREIDYQGHVSIELMNPQIWRVPPVQFGEIGITALRTVLGLATMGGAAEHKR